LIKIKKVAGFFWDQPFQEPRWVAGSGLAWSGRGRKGGCLWHGVQPAQGQRAARGWTAGDKATQGPALAPQGCKDRGAG